jgi:hypothetical protein
MAALLLLTLLQAGLAPAAPAAPATQKPRATVGNISMLLFVTDNEGRNIEGVTVTLTGPVDREMATPGGTALRMTNLRAGTYRARFTHERFITFEKEIVIRAGTAPEIAVTLNAAPPPGPARTLSLLDFLEKNFISGREPQKEDLVGCSGLGQALLWQVRDPWTGRQHESADGMVYVIGGEGSIRLDDRDVPLAAGSFAVVSGWCRAAPPTASPAAAATRWCCSPSCPAPPARRIEPRRTRSDAKNSKTRLVFAIFVIRPVLFVVDRRFGII